MINRRALGSFFSTHNRRLVSSAFVLQIVTAGLSYLSLIVLARFVAVEEFGKYTYLNSWVMVVSLIGGFGLPQVIVQLLGKFSGEKSEFKAWALIRFSYKVAFLMSGSLSLTMYFVCKYLGDWDDSWVICAFLVPIFAITNVQVGIGRASEKVVTALSITHIVRHLVVIMAVLAGWWIAKPVTANELFLWVAVLSVVALVVQASFLLPQHYAKALTDVSIAEKKEWVSSSVSFLGLSAGIFLIEQGDLLLVGLFKDEKEVALYAVASKVAYLVSFVYIAMTTSLAPRLSKLHHSRNRRDLWKLCNQSGKLMVLASGFVGLSLAIGNQHFLSLLGRQYVEAAPILIILLAGHFFFSFVGLSDSLLSMTGNQKQTLKAYVASVVTNFALVSVLVPTIGLIGAAVAHFISKLVFVLWIKYLVKKVFFVDPPVGVSYSLISPMPFVFDGDVDAVKNQYKYNLVRGLELAFGFFASIVFLPVPKNKKRIVFCGSHNRNFNFNSRYLFEYFIKNYPEMECYFVINDKVKRQQLNQKIGPYFISNKSIKNILKIAMAQTWVSTTLELPLQGVMQRVNRNVYYLNHGTIFKNAGLLEAKVSTLKRVYYKLLKFNFTKICTPSTALVPFAAKMHDVSEKDILVIGQPKNDRLFTEPVSWRLTSGIKGKKVLYTPTWRKVGWVRIFPFKGLDVDELNSWLEENEIHIFLKLHPFYEQDEVRSYLRSNIHLITSKECSDISEYLNEFDGMITDYSSLFIDFMLLKRPVIFLPYDLDAYMEDNGFIGDYHNYTPGPKPNSQSEFTAALKDLLYGGPEALEPYGYERVNRFFNEGHSKNNQKDMAEYIVRQLL